MYIQLSSYHDACVYIEKYQLGGAMTQSFKMEHSMRREIFANVTISCCCFKTPSVSDLSEK